MGFNVRHSGLYFGQEEIENAQSQRDKNEDLQAAWQWLLAKPGDVIKESQPEEKDAEPEQLIKGDLSDAGKLIEAAFRYRFAEDDAAGQMALAILDKGFGLDEQATLFETITNALTAAHAFEIIRDLLPETDAWLSDFANFTSNLLDNAEEAGFIEQLYLLTLRIVSAVLLEDESGFEAGITQFKQVIDAEVHPEGYFKSLAKALVTQPKPKEEAFRDMVLACAALTMASEAAHQAGEKLWNYENRDVGLNTAITYLVYYYFYPAKWRWGEDELSEEHTAAIFAETGAWIEISTRRINPRGVELLLEEQRPFFNPYMGGLTTLSHIQKAKRWRFGLFGKA